MHKAFKWGLRGLGALLGLLLLVVLAVYIRSEMIVGEHYDVAGKSLDIPESADVIERGRQVVLTRGCLGCHDRNGSGRVMIDDPKLATVAAPNLTDLVHEQSVASLDRSIREGVRDDGTSVVIMPSAMLSQLVDDDFVAMIAYLRSLPRVDSEPLPERSFGPIARAAFVMGQFKTERQRLHEIPQVFYAPEDAVEHGKYLAVTSCTECHGTDLHGAPEAEAMGVNPPDLRVAAAYSPENFARLLREGIPQGDESRELGLMKVVSVGRFAYFTDAQIAAIHAYLSSPEFLADETVVDR
ncbi:MAG: cytochrome c [Gammaproteobacteria bacterium]|nr:cytochrome c [Gammaproteobacteria bacterium]